MRKVCCAIIFCFFIAGAVAQNVAVVNGKPIGNKEFMWFYKKNHAGNATAAYKDLDEYLNLYINFKLKVLDAREAGMDRDTAYIKEIESYENTLRRQKRAAKANAEYSFMLNEYKEAVLMFNISEMKIWSKGQDDESQQKLEQEWVETLRNHYPVKVNHDELKKLAKL